CDAPRTRLRCVSRVGAARSRGGATGEWEGTGSAVVSLPLCGEGSAARTGRSVSGARVGGAAGPVPAAPPPLIPPHKGEGDDCEVGARLAGSYTTDLQGDLTLPAATHAPAHCGTSRSAPAPP